MNGLCEDSIGSKGGHFNKKAGASHPLISIQPSIRKKSVILPQDKVVF